MKMTERFNNLFLSSPKIYAQVEESLVCNLKRLDSRMGRINSSSQDI